MKDANINTIKNGIMVDVKFINNNRLSTVILLFLSELADKFDNATFLNDPGINSITENHCTAAA